MHDDRGLELSSTNAVAVAAYNRAIQSYLADRASSISLTIEAIEADPNFCLAHCLLGYFYMGFGTFAVLDHARTALSNAEAATAGANERERLHVEALRCWSNADLVGANNRWERILFKHPHDLLALRLHHFNCFWMGQTRALRALPASVLPSWKKDMPGYGNVLGMLAFGYEENGEYGNAERCGREAVETDPNDLWALHAVAHVLEMQVRHDEGVTWLHRPAGHWKDRNPFSRHLWWHLALFQIDAGRLDNALALYDQAIGGQQSTIYLDMQNAASLLARLEFCGLDVGDRWRALADYAEMHVDDHALTFTDVHYAMSLARERRFDAAERLIDSMKNYAGDSSKYSSNVIERLGVPLCKSIVAFGQGRYEDAVNGILPLRHITGSLGASHAQRDIFDQYLIEAALRANNLPLAQNLLQERKVMKPGAFETEYKQRRLDGLQPTAA